VVVVVGLVVVVVGLVVVVVGLVVVVVGLVVVALVVVVVRDESEGSLTSGTVVTGELNTNMAMSLS
jgi:hypothetical protein